MMGMRQLCDRRLYAYVYNLIAETQKVGVIQIDTYTYRNPLLFFTWKNSHAMTDSFACAGMSLDGLKPSFLFTSSTGQKKVDSTLPAVLLADQVEAERTAGTSPVKLLMIYR